MGEKKSWEMMAQEPPASPIDGMAYTEYHIFAQQAAQEAFELGLAKRTPENSAPMRRKEDD